MKIIINTYQAAFITPGGGEIQLLKTYENLRNLGANVSLYDQWQPNLDDCDLVHYFSVFGGSLYFCQLVKSKDKKLAISPIIWLDDMRKYPIGEMKAMLDLADLILPNSQMEADMLAQKLDLPTKKFRVVHNAVDSNAFDNIDETLFEKTYGYKNYVLCVANIEPRKNQLSLIRALNATGIDVVFIGHIRDKEYYNECQNAANENIHFLSPLPHNSPMLLSAYAGAKVFALPSILETPGLVALEAAAAGCKRLVVTGGGSTKEYFENWAQYIEDPMCEKEIQQKIMDSYNGNQLYNELKLRAYVLGNYTWENAAKETQQAYLSIS